jgi:ABC-type lipopolysaccharide export system ATPase subunit
LTREFDDDGAVLSGGELQKVELARIFAIPTPFVPLRGFGGRASVAGAEPRMI